MSGLFERPAGVNAIKWPPSAMQTLGPRPAQYAMGANAQPHPQAAGSGLPYAYPSYAYQYWSGGYGFRPALQQSPRIPWWMLPPFNRKPMNE
jgi:hypothetical protein